MNKKGIAALGLSLMMAGTRWSRKEGRCKGLCILSELQAGAGYTVAGAC